MPPGPARAVNRAILGSTLGFGIWALIGTLCFVSASYGTPSGVAVIIYALSLLACSMCSFFYNIFENSRHRPLLRYLDHSAIFLLIAGTYTPFSVHGVRGPFGIDLLFLVWSLALTGIALKVVLRGRHDRLFIGLYLLLGWLFLFSIEPFIALTPRPALLFLAAGVICYTVGAIIYGWDIGVWTDPIWHGCVLAGSIAHFCAILLLTSDGFVNVGT
jgi:hemolysin III